MMGVIPHPDRPDQVYAISRCGQVFGTQDGGKSWSESRLPEGARDSYCIACGCSPGGLSSALSVGAGETQLGRRWRPAFESWPPACVRPPISGCRCVSSIGSRSPSERASSSRMPAKRK